MFRLINRHIGVAQTADTQKPLTDAISNGRDVSSTAPEETELIARMSRDLGKLQAEQSGLSATLGMNHPKMMALDGKGVSKN